MSNGILLLATADSQNTRNRDELQLLLGCDINMISCQESEIVDAFKQYYGIGAETVNKIMEEKNGIIGLEPAE